MKQKKKYTIESFNAIFLWKTNNCRSKKKAAVAATNWDSSNEALAHKGLNWYAKQIIAKM